MIFDHLDYAEKYYKLNPAIVKAFHFIKENDIATMKPGTYEIDGEKIYAMVQHYESNLLENGVWEGHRSYWDLQYVAKGREFIGYTPLNRMKESKVYDEKEDYALFTGDDGTFIELR